MMFWRLSGVIGLAEALVCHQFPVRGDHWLAGHIVETAMLCWLQLGGGHTASSSLWHSTLFVLSQITVFCATFVLYRASPLHPLSKYPGPFAYKVSSLPGLLMVTRGKRYEELIALHERYGSFVRIGPNKLSINDHAVIEQVYSSAGAWEKGPSYKLGHSKGGGLFFLRDRESHHARRRDHWAPAFSGPAIASYAPMLNKWVDALLDSLVRDEKQNGVVDLSLALQYWTHDLTEDFVFGSVNVTTFLKRGDPNGIVPTAVHFGKVFEILCESPSLFDILWHLPATGVIRLIEQQAAMSIARRKDLGSQTPDLMKHLLNEEGRSVPPLNSDDLAQEVSVAVSAGTNGVSAVFTLAFYHLLSNPQILTKLITELCEAYPSHDGMDALQLDALSDLPYLSAVADESMRLGATFGSFPRVAPAGGAVLASRFVPEGTIVSVPVWAQNTSEKNFYPHPERFLPERWLPGGLGPGSYINRNAMMSFSHGPFGCIGRQLAYHELRVLLAKTFLRLRLDFKPGFDPRAFVDGVMNMRVTEFSVPLEVTVGMIEAQ